MSNSCETMDCSLLGSSVHGLSQARNWSGLPFLPLEDLPDSGIKLVSLMSPALQANSLPTEPPRTLFNIYMSFADMK